MTSLEAIRSYQAECAAALRTVALSPSEQFGCKLGVQDAIKEEILILMEEPECTCIQIGPSEWEGIGWERCHPASEWNRLRRAGR